MSLRKVTDYQIAQRNGAGYVAFRLLEPDLTETNWIGWNYVPPEQLASLQLILATNNAYYDDKLDVFSTGPALDRLLNRSVEFSSLNPERIPVSITAKVPKSKKDKS